MKHIFRLFLLVLLPAFAVAQAPCEAVPPRPEYFTPVVDLTGEIDEATEAELTTLIQQFEKQTTYQIQLVVMRSTGDYAADQMAFGIHNCWGVGTSELHNGVVIFISREGSNRGAFISTGYWAETEITDAECGRIYREQIPLLKEGNISAAISNMTRGVISAIGTETQAERDAIRQAQEAERGRNQAEVLNWFLNFLILVFLFCLVWYIWHLITRFRAVAKKKREWSESILELSASTIDPANFPTWARAEFDAQTSAFEAAKSVFYARVSTIGKFDSGDEISAFEAQYYVPILEAHNGFVSLPKRIKQIRLDGAAMSVSAREKIDRSRDIYTKMVHSDGFRLNRFDESDSKRLAGFEGRTLTPDEEKELYDFVSSVIDKTDELIAEYERIRSNHAAVASGVLGFPARVVAVRKNIPTVAKEFEKLKLICTPDVWSRYKSELEGHDLDNNPIAIDWDENFRQLEHLVSEVARKNGHTEGLYDDAFALWEKCNFALTALEEVYLIGGHGSWVAREIKLQTDAREMIREVVETAKKEQGEAKSAIAQTGSDSENLTTYSTLSKRLTELLAFVDDEKCNWVALHDDLEQLGNNFDDLEDEADSDVAAYIERKRREAEEARQRAEQARRDEERRREESSRRSSYGGGRTGGGGAGGGY